jgi:pyruvate,water dikinase
MENFIEEYGHRSVYETEMANPRWREDPSFILEQVRLLLNCGSVKDPRQGAQAVRGGAEQRLGSLRWPTRKFLAWLAVKARATSAMREAAKGALLILVDHFRRLTLEVGGRLVAAGLLEKSADVFHLAVSDLEAYLRGEWDGRGATALAADRQAQRERWLQECAPDVIILTADGQPAELPDSWTDRPKDKAPITPMSLHGQILRGVSASGGKATGVARVIRHPAEGLRLKIGEVLVAPSTDPGWTPLFLRASAVVMEVGGYLSHGAIVAREYGLPAVVNLPGLLSKVQDGQRLIVDGDQGLVICE